MINRLDSIVDTVGELLDNTEIEKIRGKYRHELINSIKQL